MEFNLYIGTTHIENMHAQDFQEPIGNTIWTKHQVNQEGTPKGDTT